MKSCLPSPEEYAKSEVERTLRERRERHVSNLNSIAIAAAAYGNEPCHNQLKDAAKCIESMAKIIETIQREHEALHAVADAAEAFANEASKKDDEDFSELAFAEYGKALTAAQSHLEAVRAGKAAV